MCDFSQVPALKLSESVSGARKPATGGDDNGSGNGNGDGNSHSKSGPEEVPELVVVPKVIPEVPKDGPPNGESRTMTTSRCTVSPSPPSEERHLCGNHPTVDASRAR